MNTYQTLRVATVQFQHKANDKTNNLAKIHQFIDKAATEKVNVLVFPEMCITGYWHVPKLSEHSVYALSERILDSRSLALIKQKAIEHQMAIGVGLIERDEDNSLYNTWVVCMPDGYYINIVNYMPLNIQSSIMVSNTLYLIPLGASK